LYNIKENDYTDAFNCISNALELDNHFIAGGSCYRAFVGEVYHKGDDIDVFLYHQERANPVGKAKWIVKRFPHAELIHMPYCDEMGKYDNQFGQSFNTVMKFWLPEVKKKVDFVFSTDQEIFKNFDSKLNFVRDHFDLNVSMLVFNSKDGKLYTKEIMQKDCIYIKNLPNGASYQKTHDRINKYRKINPELINVVYELNKMTINQTNPLDNDPF
jgi:hypothetical protein